MERANSARRPNTLAEEIQDTEAGERMCLQGKKRTNSRICLIRNKMALTLLTRVVFVVMMLSSAGVITTSIWLMMDCRKNFAMVRPVLPRSTHYCTNMGMPALFACCTVLFTIFGLGCTGRRLTGYSLIIISSVEFLQSVTTWTFYKCNKLSYEEVTESVNTSLITCRWPSGASSPFVISSAYVQHPDVSKLSSSTTSKRSPQDNNSILTSDTQTFKTSNDQISHNLKSKPNRKIRHLRTKVYKNKTYNKGILKSPSVKIVRESSKRERLKERQLGSERVYIHPAKCSHEDQFFIDISSRLKHGQVNKCLQICQAYQAVCQIPHLNTHILASITSRQSAATDTGRRQSEESHGKSSVRDHRALAPASHTTNSASESDHVFDNHVKDCGSKVLQHVHNLCYYDNEIILPLSLCAPMFYIAMSACFIYLAYCDRRLKEYAQTNIFIQVPASTPQKKWSWRTLPCCRGTDYQENCRLSTRKLSAGFGSLWARCPCCPSYATSPGAISSEGSNSTHELLHLRAMPFNTSFNSEKLTGAASQTTLNTCLPEDASPTQSQRQPNL